MKDEKITLTKDKVKAMLRTHAPGTFTAFRPTALTLLSQLTFTGKSEDKEYSADLEFLKPVNPDAEGTVWKVGLRGATELGRVASAPFRNSHNTLIWQVLPRSIQMLVIKETEEEEFWARLLKDKVKEKGQCAIDWDKYIDEVGDGTHPCSTCQRACAKMMTMKPHKCVS